MSHIFNLKRLETRVCNVALFLEISILIFRQESELWRTPLLSVANRKILRWPSPELNLVLFQCVRDGFVQTCIKLPLLTLHNGVGKKTEEKKRELPTFQNRHFPRAVHLL